jgi:hypothetical protein
LNKFFINPNISSHRSQNQHLIGKPFKKPEEVVRWLGAVQAQDYAGAKWAIGQRVKNCADADVEQAYIAGKILRTHMMRPTWHFVVPEDIRWMQELTSPRVHQVMGYYRRQHELDEMLLKRSKNVLIKALQGGKEKTRTELAEALKKAGITASGPRLAHLIMHAELDALISSGAMRGKQHTYALLEERVPKAKKLKRDEALAELTKRYFTSHGPALAKDFAGWSGLTSVDVKAGIEMVKPKLLHEVINEKTYWFVDSATSSKIKEPTIHLLPNYDEYFIGYKDHSPSFDLSLNADSKVLYNVLSRHIIVMNGKIIGGWRRLFRKKEVLIETKLLVALNKIQKEALHAAAEKYGKFLGMPAILTFS